jgi:hypothetical protein
MGSSQDLDGHHEANLGSGVSGFDGMIKCIMMCLRNMQIIWKNKTTLYSPLLSDLLDVDLSTNLHPSKYSALLTFMKGLESNLPMKIVVPLSFSTVFIVRKCCFAFLSVPIFQNLYPLLQ